MISLIFCVLFAFFTLAPGLPDSTSQTAGHKAPQYLVDISYRGDGQLEFTPTSLESVPVGAIIVFIAPTTAPFYLYQTSHDASGKLCSSKVKVNGLAGNSGTSQIFVVSSESKAMVYFACSAVTSPCICDRDSLFFLNPSTGMMQEKVEPVTISSMASAASFTTDTGTSKGGYITPTTPPSPGVSSAPDSSSGTLKVPPSFSDGKGATTAAFPTKSSQVSEASKSAEPANTPASSSHNPPSTPTDVCS